MSEKGLERETEGISVGEREPVVADSSPKGGRLRNSWKKLWKGRKRKALALLLVVAIAGGVVIWRGRGQSASAATTYQEAAVERRSITLLQRHAGASGLLHRQYAGLRRDPQRYL